MVEEGTRYGRYGRIIAALVLTAILLSSGFVLLEAVYHRADPVRRERLIQAELAGQVVQANDLPGSTTASAGAAGRQAVASTDLALTALGRTGLSRHDQTRLRSARTALAARPDSTGLRTALTQQVQALGNELDDRQQALDRQAGLVSAVLIVAVSVAWFWYRHHLLARHPALLRALRRQQELAGSEQRLLALVQNNSDVVTVLDPDSTASFVSPSALAMLGTPAAALVGTRIVDLVHPDDVHLLNHHLADQRAGEDETITLRMRHADGRTLTVEGMLTNLLADPTIGGFVLTIRDVTERHGLEERLTFQAFHDSLTGLANRQLFGDRLAHALQRRPGLASPLVVLFCNLDDFKNVNDGLGYSSGDKILKAIAQRIKTTVRAGDTAARLGGDEFAVLMESAELGEAERFAQRLIEVIAEPVMIDGVARPVTASVGMAQAVPGEITSEEALRNADVAMYSAKKQGKSTVSAYDSGLHAEALDRLVLRADLQRALRDNELVLHYQPTVELDTGKITGFEALVRWQHPTRGLLAPAFFIPMAEETGMIVKLGTWVLYEACRTAAVLQADWRHPTMAVNISVQQLLRPDFVDLVTHALAAAGLAADRLTLEITESVVLHDLAEVIPRLTALRQRGARVAIDDFGTGYSSLAYLTELPVDILKVDKSFIDRVASDEQGASLTEAIIRMSHTMNLSTVAEGVEVAEQAAWLRRARCAIGQGYYWSRPVDLDGVQALLARPTNRVGGELGAVTYLTVLPAGPAGS